MGGNEYDHSCSPPLAAWPGVGSWICHGRPYQGHKAPDNIAPRIIQVLKPPHQSKVAVHKIEITDLTGKTIIEHYDLEEYKQVTVLDLKKAIAEREGHPPEKIRLVYQGRPLEDEELLYKVILVTTQTPLCATIILHSAHVEKSLGERKELNLSMDRLADFDQPENDPSGGCNKL